MSVERLFAQCVVQSVFFLPTLVSFVGMVDIIKGSPRSDMTQLFILDSVFWSYL